MDSFPGGYLILSLGGDLCICFDFHVRHWLVKVPIFDYLIFFKRAENTNYYQVIQFVTF